MMKRNLVLTAVTLVGMAGALVMAQTPATEGPTGSDTKGMSGMKEKMSPETKMHCQMLMGTAVSPSDPEAILALKDQLKLTEDQTAQLEAINKESRDKAIAVLTTDQKTTLDALPKSPQTMKDMHEQMMGKMQKMMGGKMGEQQTSCPMMKMMEGQMSTTTEPKVDAPAGPDHTAHH